jgi:uncharacterized protein YceK
MCSRKTILLILSITVLLLSGCSSYSQSTNAFVGGETVTPERLDEISRQLATTDEESDTDAEITVDLNYNGKCYWVSGSEVFHTSKDCRYIKNSDSVINGDAAAAAADGCVRMCSACEKESVKRT